MKPAVIERHGIQYVEMRKAVFDRLIKHYRIMIGFMDADSEKEEQRQPYPADLLRSIIGGKNPIAAFRGHHNLSQTELARRLGISKAYLSELEHSKKEPSVKVLKALAEELNVPMEWLVS